MYCCSFKFKPGIYDDDFNKLNNAIDLYCTSLTDFSHVETWKSDDGKSQNSMYYFRSLEAIEKLANLKAHLQAKQEVDRWYLDYEVEVFELIRSYGKSSPANP
jgi:heme-degrading monooxygenase HmoA